jgi:hypothetical protein
MRMPPYELRGREESYEDGVEYVAVVHITLSHKPNHHSEYRDMEDAACVVERAAMAAAAAYNLARTRLASVRVVEIKRGPGPEGSP